MRKQKRHFDVRPNQPPVAALCCAFINTRTNLNEQREAQSRPEVKKKRKTRQKWPPTISELFGKRKPEISSYIREKTYTGEFLISENNAAATVT